MLNSPNVQRIKLSESVQERKEQVWGGKILRRWLKRKQTVLKPMHFGPLIDVFKDNSSHISSLRSLQDSGMQKSHRHTSTPVTWELDYQPIQNGITLPLKNPVWGCSWTQFWAETAKVLSGVRIMSHPSYTTYTGCLYKVLILSFKAIYSSGPTYLHMEIWLAITSNRAFSASKTLSQCVSELLHLWWRSKQWLRQSFYSV